MCTCVEHTFNKTCFSKGFTIFILTFVRKSKTWKKLVLSVKKHQTNPNVAVNANDITSAIVNIKLITGKQRIHDCASGPKQATSTTTF